MRRRKKIYIRLEKMLIYWYNGKSNCFSTKNVTIVTLLVQASWLEEVVHMLAQFLEDILSILKYKEEMNHNKENADALQSVCALRLTAIPAGMEVLLQQYYICCVLAADQSNHAVKMAAEGSAKKIEADMKAQGYSVRCGIEAIQYSMIKEVREAIDYYQDLLNELLMIQDNMRDDYKVAWEIAENGSKGNTAIEFDNVRQEKDSKGKKTEDSENQETSSGGSKLDNPFEAAKREMEKKKDAAKTLEDEQKTPLETGGTHRKGSRKRKKKEKKKGNVGNKGNNEAPKDTENKEETGKKGPFAPAQARFPEETFFTT